jgi:hypothetical protein
MPLWNKIIFLWQWHEEHMEKIAIKYVTSLSEYFEEEEEEEEGETRL